MGGSGLITSYPDLQSSSHFMRVAGKIVDGKTFGWQSGMTAAIISTKFNVPPGEILPQPGGDFNSAHPSWTGGWVNQLRFKDLSFGVNLQYHYSEIINAVNGQTIPGTTSTLNSILLQYVYAGYRLKLAKGNPLEIYIDSRNLLQGSKSDLTDRRRYVGVGGKLGL